MFVAKLEHVNNVLKSAGTSMTDFSRHTHIVDPDQTALRGAV